VCVCVCLYVCMCVCVCVCVCVSHMTVSLHTWITHMTVSVHTDTHDCIMTHMNAMYVMYVWHTWMCHFTHTWMCHIYCDASHVAHDCVCSDTWHTQHSCVWSHTVVRIHVCVVTTHTWMHMTVSLHTHMNVMNDIFVMYVHASCGFDVGSWVSTDIHLDNYEIQKVGTNFNILYGAIDCRITYRRRKLILFPT